MRVLGVLLLAASAAGAAAAPEAALLAVRLGLAAVLAVAGTAKLLDVAGTRRTLPALGVPAVLVAPVALALPLVELALAVLLVPATTAALAAVVVATLLFVMSVALVRAALTGAVEDCGCFGAAFTVRPRSAIARNAGLFALAALIALTTPPAMTPTAGIALAVTALVAAQAWAWWHLLRAHGRLLARLDALEADRSSPRPAGDRGAAGSARTPLPGESAPAFALPDAAGRVGTLDDLLAPALPLALVFSDPDCGACDGLPERLAVLQAEVEDELRIALVTRGQPAPGPFAPTLYQTEHEVARRYGAGQMPSMLLVSSDGRIDSPLVLGVEAIERLILPSHPEVLH